MARNRTVATDIDLDQAPAAGGSYMRNTDTGELVQVEGTQHGAKAEDAAAPDTPAAATPAAIQE